MVKNAIHIGWARWSRVTSNSLEYIFSSGIKKPDHVHSWFKVYKHG